MSNNKQVITKMTFSTVCSVLVLTLPAVLSQLSDCRPGPPPHCSNWSFRIDQAKPSGALVHGHANFPIHEGSAGSIRSSVHGSHVFGGPNNGANTVGGGVKYQHNNGLYVGLGATNTRGSGTSFNGNAGGSTKLGPGTLSVGAGASTIPGSSRIQGQVGATYTIRFK